MTVAALHRCRGARRRRGPGPHGAAGGRGRAWSSAAPRQPERADRRRAHGGQVPDFVTLDHWPTFNVADACVTVGVVLVIVALLLGGRTDVAADEARDGRRERRARPSRPRSRRSWPASGWTGPWPWWPTSRGGRGRAADRRRPGAGRRRRRSRSGRAVLREGAIADDHAARDAATPASRPSRACASRSSMPTTRWPSSTSRRAWWCTRAPATTKGPWSAACWPGSPTWPSCGGGRVRPDRPGIVHRLDKGTSGLLAVARTAEAFRSLVDQLADQDDGAPLPRPRGGPRRRTTGARSTRRSAGRPARRRRWP